MELMKKVVLTACILSMVIIIAECLKPGERFAAQINPIFSLVFVLGVVAAALRTAFDFELPGLDNEVYAENYSSINEKTTEILKENVENRINEYIGELLKRENVQYEEIISEININENGSINIIRIGYLGNSFEKARRIIVKNFPDTEVNKNG